MTTLRILILSPTEPYPPHGGWPLVVYHDIEQLLAMGHNVYVLAITNNPKADPTLMRELCPTEYFYKHKPARWCQLLKNIGNPLPFSISRYVDDRLFSAAKSLIQSENIDVVLLEDESVGPYGSRLRDATGTPCMLRAHNVGTQIFERFMTSRGNPISKAIVWNQSRKYVAFERELLETANAFSMISTSDAAEIARRYPPMKAQVVGAGTDLKFFQRTLPMTDDPRIVHVGSLTAFTKLEAMQWFCREVLPLVRTTCPNARLQLIGQMPKGTFDNYDGVEPIGRVDDVRPYMWEGKVFVAPQFVGSGVRLKLINAMSAGCAIVCTPVACEGLNVLDGTHLLIREDPKSFSEAVTSLLNDRSRCETLGNQARQLAEREYSWDIVGKHLERILLGITRTSSGKS